MKIKNICKVTALLGAGAMLMSGCASDYLDTPTHGTLDATQIASTTDNARATLLGCASSMANYWHDGSSWSTSPAQELSQGETGMLYYLAEIPGQDCYVNFIYDVAPNWLIYYNQEENMLNSGGYVWNEPMWLYCYANINQLNELIHYIDGAEGDEQLREFTKGQAYALRAHFYWRLLQIYAPRWEDSAEGTKLSSVVIRTEIDEPTEEEVAPMNDVLDLIYSDLDKSIEAFGKAGAVKRMMNYEPTLNIAYGIYARTAALKHDWEKCREMANKARQGYRLPTVQEAMSGYCGFNANEWMWSPSFEDIDNLIYCNWCTFFCCNSYGAINARYTNSIDIMLYRRLPETDARREWWLTADKLSGINKNMVYNSKAVDPTDQKFTAVALTKAARAWLDEHKATYNLPGDGAYSGPASTTVIRDGAQVKFWCDGLTGNNTRAQLPFMRATEMYLYEAEALAELHRDGEAQDLLEEINKVYNPEYTCEATGDALIDEVRLYRRIELWGEGFNWFDFKRWNMPIDRKAWEEGKPASGNVRTELAVTVPVTRNNGWRHGVPIRERTYNLKITTPIPGEQLSN